MGLGREGEPSLSEAGSLRVQARLCVRHVRATA